MEKQIKKQVNKLFSFCMALVMVLTSLTITPIVANAEELGTEVAGTVSGTNMTVHFKNSKSWDQVYTKFGESSSWTPISGLEYCKNAEYGGIVNENANNAGWWSFKVTSDTEITSLNGKFNNGSWGDEERTAEYVIDAGKTEAWITFNEETGDAITVSYDKPSGWIDGAEVAAPVDPATVDTGVYKPEETNLKLYYYITEDTGKTCDDYAINVWGGAALTEAGTYLTITAWDNQTYRKLLDSGEVNTIDDYHGRWAYVGLDSNSITGMQFLTVDGGENVWNSRIKSLELTEAYYVPGYGWFEDAACTKAIKELELRDEFYIVGGVKYGETGDASVLGSWDLEKGVKMTKTEEGVYQVTITLPAGTYEFTPIQDPLQFGWKYQFKDYNNVNDKGDWGNYIITVEKDCDVVFTVKNPEISTGKAEVTTEVKVKEEEKEEVKKYTVTFKDGEKVLKTETVESGKAATAPALPAKTGYTASWDKAFANVTADTVVNVKWTANTYTLTYNVNGGSKLKTATKTITYDSTYGELAKPVRKGYSFKGWYTAKTKGTKVTSSTKVTGNVTIYAQWKKVTKPGKVTIKSVKNSSKKAMKVTLKSVKGADGYEIRYSTKKNMKSAKKVTSKKTTVTIKSLKEGKTYYVQARAYKLDSAGKKIYSSKYSTTKTIEIKK